MNRLSPDLVKLMRWARRSPEPPAIPVTGDFIRRVLARREFEAAGVPFFAELRWVFSVSVWGSVVLIVGGLAILFSAGIEKDTPYDFTPAYRTVARSLIP